VLYSPIGSRILVSGLSAAGPVDEKRLACDVARRVAGEEEKWAVQFFGTRGVTEDGMCRDPGDLVGVVELAAGGAGEEAWCERVDSDSAGAPLGCELAGEGDDPGFARAVAGQRIAVEADHGGRRGDVHRRIQPQAAIFGRGNLHGRGPEDRLGAK
jgi:hypothetical protein